MRNVKHILFPVDFSEKCRSVRPFVKSMAQRFGARVTLMHVLQIPTGFYTGLDAPYPIALDLDAMRQSIDQITSNMATNQEQITRSIDRIAARVAASQEQLTRSVDQLAVSQEWLTREITKLEEIEQSIRYRNSDTLPPSPRPASASAPKPVTRPASTSALAPKPVPRPAATPTVP